MNQENKPVMNFNEGLVTSLTSIVDNNNELITVDTIRPFSFDSTAHKIDSITSQLTKKIEHQQLSSFRKLFVGNNTY